MEFALLFDLRNECWVDKELPNLEQLNHHLLFTIALDPFECFDKKEHDLLFEPVDVTPLHVLQDAVHDVDIRQSALTLGGH